MFGKKMSAALALAAAGIASATGMEHLSNAISTDSRGFGFSNNFSGGKFVGHILDRSRYMPHQGERECARRRRQMGIA